MATVNGNDSNNTLSGTASADTVNALGGNDVVYASAGNDIVYGGSGLDTLYGDAGADTIYGGSEADQVYGGNEADSLHGDAGNDTLGGGAGNDTLSGGTGNDTLFGGTETDTIDYSGSTAGVTVSLASGTASGGGGSDLLTGFENVTGSGSADEITGDGAANLIAGGEGNDTIISGGGADTVYGGGGNDVINGEGDLLVNGGFEAGQAPNSWSGNTVHGWQSASGQFETWGNGFNSTSTSSTLTSDGGGFIELDHNSSSVDRIWQDVQTGAGESYTFSIDAMQRPSTTTNSFEVYWNGTLVATVTPGTAWTTYTTTVTGTGGVVRLEIRELAAQDDSLGVLLNNASLLTSSGADTLDGGDGADTISGGGGDDSLIGGSGNDVLDGGTGSDSLDGGADADTLTGGDGSDTVDGGDGDDVIAGADTDGQGDDTLYGGNGNDTINGGAGANENDTIYGGAGDDVIGAWGGTGDEDIYAGDGHDTITLNGGSFEEVFGGADRDTIVVTAPTSGFLTGDGTGDDDDTLDLRGLDNFRLTYDSGNPESGTVEFLDPLTGLVTHTLTFTDIEKVLYTPVKDGIVEGTNADDTIDTGYTGDPDGDLVDAGDAILTGAQPDDDVIEAYGGSDVVHAGAGNDLVYAGDDSDRVFGGTGDDTLHGEGGADDLSGGEGGDRLLGGAGGDAIDGGKGDDTLSGGDDADTLFGGEGRDTLDGDHGSDVLDGGSGADALTGGDGDDTLAGGADADHLDGGADRDDLDGGDGDDTLVGGLGDDRLDGGAGADTLDGGTGSDTFFGGAGDEVFGGEDPSGGETDVLDLSAHGFHGVQVAYNPGNPEEGTVTFLDAFGVPTGSLTFTGIERVIRCFTPGTMVETDRGPRAVEMLRAGDRVVTRDRGPQPLREVLRRELTRGELVARPEMRPVRIAAGALGNGMPVRDMVVSPQHRMLVEGARAEMLFGEPEVLVPAVHLVGRPGITRDAGLTGATYLHLRFDRHEVVHADGAWSESFQPCAAHSPGQAAVRAELLALFPALRAQATPVPAVRRSLKSHETRALFAA